MLFRSVFIFAERSTWSVITHSIRICTVTTERRNSRKRNTIGGGKRIASSKGCKWRKITTVRAKWLADVFVVGAFLITYLRASLSGLVVFLEEDHYVAPDFIHMLHLMERARQSHCPSCRILSLGSYLKTVDFAADGKKVTLYFFFFFLVDSFKTVID